MSKFKKGDRIITNNIEGYYVECMNGHDVMERIDGKGWKRKHNVHLVPDDYIPINGDSYWAITISYCKLIKAAEFNYEIY